MKRFMTKLLTGAFLAGGVMATGCHSVHSLHGMGGCADGDCTYCGDPCWPDRYANEARAATVASFQPQVENGHVLDQTIWNMHFDYGTDRLNGAGMDKLDQLARRRPHPDTKLYMQTARDIPYDAANPSDYSAKRNELDTKRITAIQKYLAATLTGRPANFDIQVHDPAYPGIDGAAPRVIVPTPQSRIGAVAPGVAVVAPAPAYVPPPPPPPPSSSASGTRP
jgi:hypothetical protein